MSGHDKNIILFVDDDLGRAVKWHEWLTEEEIDKVIWAKTVSEALIILRDYPERITQCHLDYELTPETEVDYRRNDCGMEIIRWFENIAKDKLVKFATCEFTIHTHYEIIGMQMRDRLRELGLKAKYIPFGLEETNIS